MNQVYLYQNGQRTGPYDVAALRASLQSAQLKASDPAWFEGCKNWVTLADVPGVMVEEEGSTRDQSEKKTSLGVTETASSLHVSRNGQTFGPYTYEQANQFLLQGQLLPTDYALLEGQTEWKHLSDLLDSLREVAQGHKQAEKADLPALSQISSLSNSSSKAKQPGSKSIKIQGINARSSVIKVREKGLLSKLIATCVVFFVTLLVVVGSTLGAYLIVPSQVGPVVRKFGIPIEQWFPGRELESIEIVEAPPGRLQDIRIGKEQWHHINSSGIKLLPIEGDVGLQVISPIDQKQAMNDDDLEVLLLIAQHLVILDLTKSEVSDDGLAILKKFPNLKKLTLEGSEKISSAGVRHLAEIISLENLNLVRVKLDDSAVDSLSTMEGLREVYLYNTNLSEEAIERLKAARPQMFVNAG